MRPVTEHRQQGVTLIEMIVVIVVTGVVVSLAGMFGRWQIQAYFDVAGRAALADAGDTALRRISRELQAALPNSVRVSASGDYLEFIPVSPNTSGGRYRADVDAAGAGKAMNVAAATEIEVDVFGPPVSVGTGEWLAIYNLGLDDYTAYEAPGSGKSSRRAVSVTGGGAGIKFTPVQAGKPMLASPQHRFHIISSPVMLQCAPNPLSPASGVVRRHKGYDFQATLADAIANLSAGSAATLVSGVVACRISYTPGVMQRNGLVTIRLTLANDDGSERVELLQQVEVANAP